MNGRITGLSILLAGLYLGSNAANMALVPQTGQTSTMPLNPAPAGSDGALQKGAAWPRTRFTTDTSGNCITDTLTGLMWVRDLNVVNGGNAVSWATALTIAVNGTWCGYGDWRVPNVNELRSLVNYGESSGPAAWLNVTGGFSNVVANSYWSSSSYASSGGGAPASAWFVSMYDGSVGAAGKSGGDNVRRLFPVRGGL